MLPYSTNALPLTWLPFTPQDSLTHLNWELDRKHSNRPEMAGRG